MATRIALMRKLWNRIPDLEALDIQKTGAFRFKVSFSVRGPRCFDDVAADVTKVLDSSRAAAVAFSIEQLPEGAQIIEAPVQAHLQMAALFSDQSVNGLPQTLIDVVHDLGAVYIQDQPGKAIFHVARQDGSAPEEFLQRVRAAVEVVGFLGMPFEVKAIVPGATQPIRRGVPSRDPRLIEFTEADNVRFAEQIKRLTSGQADQVVIADEEGSSKIYLTPSIGKIDVGAVLPLYGRIFVEMPPRLGDTHYFESAFGLAEDTFKGFCRAGCLVPVFKHNLGHYPESVWRCWVEDPTLPLVSPRQSDYLAMRYLWNGSPFIRLLRENPAQLQALEHAMAQILRLGGPDFRSNKWLYDVLGWMVSGSEEFEGMAFHRGSMALASLSPAGVAAHLLAAGAPERFQDKAIAQTLSLDGFAASQSLATAQAFRASLFDNLVLNPPVLTSMVPYFQETIEVQGRLGTRQITELVHGLELQYSDKIPVNEYLAIMTEHETPRIRGLIQQLLEGADASAVDQELRYRVLRLNADVAKLEKKDLHVSVVDVLGDISSVSGAIGGAAAFGWTMFSKIVGGKLAEKLTTRAVNSTLDGPAGDVIDMVRGALNGVSPSAVRLFRLRNKLKR